MFGKLKNLLAGGSRDAGAARASLAGALEQIRRLGFSPTTVLDVGAGAGTPPLYAAFPSARHVLFEPIAEQETALQTLQKQYPGMEYVRAAAGARSGRALINVHTDHLHGSSLLKEQLSDFDGVEREIDIVTIDETCARLNCAGPFLIKLDTQGAELEALRGATQTLAAAEYVLMEVSFFEFYKGSPLAADVIAFMQERGFAIYDMLGKNYRPLDGALAQADLAFVKRDGQFRKSNLYATADQWSSQAE